MQPFYTAIISIITIVSISACSISNRPLQPGIQSQAEPKNELVSPQLPMVDTPERGSIALQANGEIYTMDIDDTSIKRVTRTLQGAFSPDWSPDGKRIVYTTNDGLFITNRDGTGNVQVGKSRGGEPSWSSDGERIIFFSSCNLFVVNIDGSNERELSYEKGEFDICSWSPDWSPDGKRVVFLGMMSINNIYGHINNEDLFIVNTDGSGLRRITENYFTESEPTLIPDAGYYSPTYTGEKDPAWSPDGKSIAFSMNMAPTDRDNHIFILEVDGDEEPRRLIQQNRFSSEWAPAWSPDGQWLVFLATEDNPADERLWIASADGSELIQLSKVSDHDADPSWSPFQGN